MARRTRFGTKGTLLFLVVLTAAVIVALVGLPRSGAFRGSLQSGAGSQSGELPSNVVYGSIKQP